MTLILYRANLELLLPHLSTQSPPRTLAHLTLHQNPKDALNFLQLQRHQQATAPFENLQLHYSSHHTVSLNTEHLYAKIVEKDNRGGYCMENKCFFGTILRSLGYTLHSAGARVAVAASGTPAEGSFGWKVYFVLLAVMCTLREVGHI